MPRNNRPAKPSLTASSSYEQRLIDWLRAALVDSGMQHAELARRLAYDLDRPVERGTIGALLNGTRRLKADEMLSIATICRVSLPRIGRSKRGPLEADKLYA